MPENNIVKKTALPLRHSPSVKNAVDNIARLENLSPSTMYRKVFNAGLKCLYDIEVVNNQIVD